MDLMLRFYDPSIGRFMQVDPVTETQENYSTYQYGWNNPILQSDPNGDCPSCPQGEEAEKVYAVGAQVTNKDGSWTWTGKEWQTNTVNGEAQNASTVALPLTLSLPLAGLGEKVTEISLNGLKAIATVPLMTLAFVLTPTTANAPAPVFGDNRTYYTPPPQTLPGFPGAKKVPRRGRARWVTPDGDILEWDSQHGEVEVYNKRGKHKGVADPNTGEMLKDPVPGRTTEN